MYKFLVTASHATLGVTQAAVVLETLSPPSQGSVTVSPMSGEAMRDLFTLSAAGFHDSDVPLVYTFSFRHLGRSEVVLLQRLTSSLPEVEVRLPYSSSGIEILVEVCDALDACTEAVSEVVDVSVMLLDLEDIKILGQEVAALATNQECVEALSLLRRTLDSVKAEANTAARFQGPLCTLHSSILAQCSAATIERMDCTELGTAGRVVDFMVKTECRLTPVALEEGQRLSRQLQNTTTR